MFPEMGQLFVGDVAAVTAAPCPMMPAAAAAAAAGEGCCGSMEDRCK